MLPVATRPHSHSPPLPSSSFPFIYGHQNYSYTRSFIHTFTIEWPTPILTGYLLATYRQKSTLIPFHSTLLTYHPTWAGVREKKEEEVVVFCYTFLNLNWRALYSQTFGRLSFLRSSVILSSTDLSNLQ